MAEDKQQPKKIRRLQIGVNVVIQVALVLFIAVIVNSIGIKHYKRWDLSRDQKYALSDKTKRFLGTMKGKMRVTVLFLQDSGVASAIASDVQSLLTKW
jgi:hypothetical protein